VSKFLVVTGVVLLLVAACAATGFPADSEARVASGLPDRFLVRNLPKGVPAEPGACRSPVVDPDSGARLTLVRSSGGRGDYQVSDGRYGAGDDELLRIDCASGTAIGLVRR